MNSKKSLTLIFITLLIDVIGLGMIIPVLPELLSTIGKFSNSEASLVGGLMIFSYAAAQFLFSPILGNLSDHFGRRPILLISLFGLGVDYIFHALAPTLALLFVGRVLAGICGASFTTASAYIADVSEDDNRAQNFGMIGMAFGIGFILGPVLGGLVGNLGVRAPFWFAAGLSLINCTLCYFMLPESLPKEQRRSFSLKRANPLGTFLQLRKFPRAMWLMVPMFLLYLGSHAVQSNWAFYTVEKFHWTKTQIGISLGVVGVCIAVVQGGLIRIIVPKLGEKKSILVGFFLYFVGMLLFAVASMGWMMYAFTVVYCLGGIGGPALQGLLSKQVPKNQQGELNGGLTALMSITAIIGPLMMNSIFSYYTDRAHHHLYLPGAPMLLGALLMLLATFACIRPLRKAS